MEAYIQVGGVSLAKALLEGSSQLPPDVSNKLSWCICGTCRNMHTPEENVCCTNRASLTTTNRFETIVLNRDLLPVAIVHWADVYSEDPVYAPSNYHKAAYRQWTLRRCGYLGRGNNRVVPARVVWAVQDKYSAPNGIYIGFKNICISWHYIRSKIQNTSKVCAFLAINSSVSSDGLCAMVYWIADGWIVSTGSCASIQMRNSPSLLRLQTIVLKCTGTVLALTME